MRLLPAIALLGALAIAPALAPTPAAACVYGNCPCVGDLAEGTEATICYEGPGPITNSFAYVGSLNLFMQVTDFWCRRNGQFFWISPEVREGCLEGLENLCDDGIQCTSSDGG